MVRLPVLPHRRPDAPNSKVANSASDVPETSHAPEGPGSPPWPGPYSSGRATKPVARPLFWAASRSEGCAATSITSAGSRPSKRAGSLVCARVGFEGLADIGTEYHIPRQTGVLRHIDQQSGVAVGQRPDNDMSLHGPDSLDAIRPRWQPAPRPGEILHLILGQRLDGDAELLERCEQVFSVQNVERHEFPTARADFGH